MYEIIEIDEKDYYTFDTSEMYLSMLTLIRIDKYLSDLKSPFETPRVSSIIANCYRGDTGKITDILLKLRDEANKLVFYVYTPSRYTFNECLVQLKNCTGYTSLRDKEHKPYTLNKCIEYYGVTSDYDEETVEVADNYCTVFVNESLCYEAVGRFFKNNPNTEINFDFPYKLDCTNSEYRSALKKLSKEGKANFAALCRVVIWNYYAEEFNIPRLPIKVRSKHTQPIDPDLDQLTDEINQHMANAEQSFKKVEIEMNTLTKYAKTPSVTVQLIHGRPADEYTEEELMALIRNAKASQESIADLVDTSKRMKEKSEQYSADIAVYVEALDNLK